MSFDNGIIRQLLDGIHGIVAADINKRIDLQFVQNRENFLINLHVLMDLRKLISAGPQKCGRRPLQKLNIQIGMNLCGHIHILLIQKALNPVQHAVHLVEATLNGVFVNACQAGVDDRSGAARLSYDNVSLFCRHFFILLFQWIPP